ncbi:iron-containing alcohol dehydrogenase [Bradyrhizobium sp. CER78]|uniref:iron-containing alcohol dehydrogenase n=1 Tax=Bradyrhizobium sp. CER78 TaxID=3039162 RepID=UPI00244CA674|nr:iron-containing alcohol dehydrogenase [Bradyrhizobium sp. CER78]MDH2384490.1 iron-containing alcohol dehydrogenase [Bradyrhizobium sp. CER78]
MGIVDAAIRDLADEGFERPMIFTVEPLLLSTKRAILPHLHDAAGMLSDFPPHAPDSAIEDALDRCIQAGARSIVAFGGGSVLDAAKAVSHFHYLRQGRYLPLVALPTTLSGSEFSHYFGITETSGPRPFKRSYAERATVPKIVLMDPGLLLNTPRALLLSSAIKGLDHAIEGMRQVDVDHPHAVMAAAGANKFFSVLERWPADLETEEAIQKGTVDLSDLLQLQLAAWQCYFYPASVIYGLSHRIGHILGGTFGFPHSATSCITLAPVIRACEARYGNKLQVFNSPGESNPGPALAARIENLVSYLGLPSHLRSFEIGLSALPEIADLLRANYKAEVADLGEDADRKLDALLRSLW